MYVFVIQNCAVLSIISFNMQLICTFSMDSLVKVFREVPEFRIS